MKGDSDASVRLRAFEWPAEQTAQQGEVLPWSIFQTGFRFGGEKVSLVAMPGIFTPRLCRYPLTIRTSVGGPYVDSFAATVRTRPDEDPRLPERMLEEEMRLVGELRRASYEDVDLRVRRAVLPLLAAVVGPPA